MELFTLARPFVETLPLSSIGAALQDELEEARHADRSRRVFREWPLSADFCLGQLVGSNRGPLWYMFADAAPPVQTASAQGAASRAVPTLSAALGAARAAPPVGRWWAIVSRYSRASGTRVNAIFKPCSVANF